MGESCSLTGSSSGTCAHNLNMQGLNKIGATASLTSGDSGELTSHALEIEEIPTFSSPELALDEATQRLKKLEVSSNAESLEQQMSTIKQVLQTQLGEAEYR